MRRCDCSTLSTCEVCCPPRTESELQDQINDLKSGYEAYRDRPSTSAPDLKPEDYARHYRIDAADETYSALSFQLVQERAYQVMYARAHALLTGIKDRF